MSADKELRLIAVMRSAQGGATVSELCENLEDTRIDVRIGPIEEFVNQDNHLNGNDVLLLDIDTSSSEDHRNLRTILSEKFPSTPILVTAPDVSLDEVRTLMQIGVIDVLSQPMRQADLVIALDHATRLRPKAPIPSQPTERGKVISFLQGGGGVGATVLAIQGGCILATEAAKEGAKVCLLDFDIQFGTAGLYLDMDSSPEPRCGKTTAQKVAGELVNKAKFADNISPSAVFRWVEQYKPTLIIDEVDQWLTLDSELIQLLTSGYEVEGNCDEIYSKVRCDHSGFSDLYGHGPG